MLVLDQGMQLCGPHPQLSPHHKQSDAEMLPEDVVPHPGQDIHMTDESRVDPLILPSGDLQRSVGDKFLPQQVERTLQGLWVGKFPWWSLSDPAI